MISSSLASSSVYIWAVFRLPDDELELTSETVFQVLTDLGAGVGGGRLCLGVGVGVRRLAAGTGLSMLLYVR